MTLAEMNAYLDSENAKYRDHFQDVPKDSWPARWPTQNRAVQYRILRNNQFLVQLFRESGIIRMTVNRTRLKSAGRWEDGITWDELQKIKSQVGFGDFDAVEIYPKDSDVVDVANMRHLWILTKDSLPFIWRKESA